MTISSIELILSIVDKAKIEIDVSIKYVPAARSVILDSSVQQHARIVHTFDIVRGSIRIELECFPRILKT